MKKTLLLPLLALLAGLNTLPAQADVLRVNSAEALAAQLTQSGQDRFSDLAPDTPYEGGQARQAGNLRYTIGQAGRGLYGFDDGQGGLRLSTDAVLDPLQLSGFGAGLNAFGADLFGLDTFGSARADAVLQVAITDMLGAVYLERLDFLADSMFFGFISSVPLASLSFSVLEHGGVGGYSYISPALASVTLGSTDALAVPEPTGPALVGLALLGLAWTRRRAV